MKNSAFFILTFILISCTTDPSIKTLTSTEDGYTYEHVMGDPMKTRIYTLNNGLKVYMSQYKNEPRIQIDIAVKAGGKNDPASHTGLAHYLEHIMFKGTDVFGSLNFKEEAPKLDSIEAMFNYYSTITDSLERVNYYKLIDQFSNDAAKLAIPNEYNKMIAEIGGQGTNAYTTEDRTVYITDVPANELSKFLKIQGARFNKIVPRLFHTELEAVYEEKNRSLDNDYWKVSDALKSELFKNHPYGTQSVIGTIDHLKKPSITEIKKYFATYYRPNNIAICMSGDLEFTPTIKMIEDYFGDWTPNNDLPKWNKILEEPITAPIEKEIWGPEAEFLQIGYRFNGLNSEDYLKTRLIDMILSNSEVGLIDLNLTQKQEVLSAGSYISKYNDYCLHILRGTAKQNQSLQEVKELLLEQVNLLKNGAFDDWLIQAIVNNLKTQYLNGLESNRFRTTEMTLAFTNDIPWGDHIQQIERLEKTSKDELIAFAQENYKENYVVVYKKNGEDVNKTQVSKPEITKLNIERENSSDFHKELLSMDVPKLQPVFINFKDDIERSNVQNVEILSKVNSENDLFQLIYLLDIGKNTNPKLGMAMSYLEYLGSEKYTSEEIKKELFKLGCSFYVSVGEERSYVVIYGLNKNMESATKIIEELLATAQPDHEALELLVDRIQQARADDKKDKSTILWGGLRYYAQYGANNPFSNVLDNYELEQLDPSELIQIIQKITSYPHKILYYGPKTSKEVSAFVAKNHPVPSAFEPIPENKIYEELAIDTGKVYWIDYDMVQTEVVFLSKGAHYDPINIPTATLFNEYIDGSSSVIFEEIREAQGLAYAVFSTYQTPSKVNKSHYLFTYIGTQADKQSVAIDAITNLINNIPASEEAFLTAKSAVLSKLESERITKSAVIWSYLDAQDKGIDYDIRKNIYEKIRTMTLSDLMDFHEKYIKNNNFTTVLIGSKDKIDFQKLAKYGEIKQLSLTELFGYGENAPVELK